MPPDLQGRNHTLAPPRNDAPAPLGFYGLEASRPKIQAFSKRWGRSSGPDPALPEWWSLLAPPGIQEVLLRPRRPRGRPPARRRGRRLPLRGWPPGWGACPCALPNPGRFPQGRFI